MELYERISALVCPHGPSGDEEQIRRAITEMARPFADEITVDILGNLIAHKRGDGPKILYSAHMDSVGFIVTHIEPEGFLRVGRLGGITAKDCLYTPVRFKNGVRGVFVPEEKTEFSKLKLDECCIDIGAKDAAEAKSMVQVGDTAVYDTPLRKNNRKVFSPYMDNRISCAILLAAMEQIQECSNDLYFLFSSQEEVGTRGARAAAWTVEPDYGIAVDVTDVDDNPGSEKYGTAKLGKGAAIKVMDSSVICHPSVIRKLEETAVAKGIPVQRDILRAGGTDAGPIHTTKMGVLTGGISVPCRYIHTPTEAVDLDDAEACVQLVAAFAQLKHSKHQNM